MGMRSPGDSCIIWRTKRLRRFERTWPTSASTSHWTRRRRRSLGRPMRSSSSISAETSKRSSASFRRTLPARACKLNYIDPIENQTHYMVKSVEKVGRSFAIKAVVTTSPAAAKKWKEEEEAAHKKASFFTIVCKSRAEAERQVQKLQ